jgi:hypothetical protein
VKRLNAVLSLRSSARPERALFAATECVLGISPGCFGHPYATRSAHCILGLIVRSPIHQPFGARPERCADGRTFGIWALRIRVHR